MLSSGHDMAVALMNSLRLWLLAANAQANEMIILQQV